jgi:hypothetical protein
MEQARKIARDHTLGTGGWGLVHLSAFHRRIGLKLPGELLQSPDSLKTQKQFLDTRQACKTAQSNTSAAPSNESKKWPESNQSPLF